MARLITLEPLRPLQNRAKETASLQLLQYLETQGILPDDWWRWPAAWQDSSGEWALTTCLHMHPAWITLLPSRHAQAFPDAQLNNREGLQHLLKL